MGEERYFIKSFYGELWARTIRKYPLLQLHESFIDTLGPDKGDIVLEIGAGEGRFMPLVVREKATYVGVDIAVRCLKYAKDRVRSKTKEYVHFVAAEARHLPFKSKSINKSFYYGTLFYIPNKKYALNEMERVSKEKMLIEFKNSLSPTMFFGDLATQTINFLLSLPIRSLLLAILRFLMLQKKETWLEIATKDNEVVAEPRHFPDSPNKILSYFTAPIKIYSTSSSGLKVHHAKREWLFKPVIVVEVNLNSG